MSTLESYYKKINLLSKKEVDQIDSASYWNNSDAEKQKIWGQWNENFDILEKKFLEKGLLDQLVVEIKKSEMDLNGKTLLSLGAGICILEAQLVEKYSQIEKILCLEFSKHRVFDIAPHIFKNYKIPTEKVELLFGSFLETGVKNETIDFIILSQSFHHAFQPGELLKEIFRVLKPNGKVFILGEHYFSPLSIVLRLIKHFPKYILNHKEYRERSGVIPSWRGIFPIDNKKGDHHYNLKQYSQMFIENGFNFKRFIFKKYMNQGFILTKSLKRPITTE
jgi:ubiquinone/menaquinone biosynthesis C-methylase UbiE